MKNSPGETGRSLFLTKKGPAQNAQDPQPVEKPRVRIRGQPEFRHIMWKTAEKTGNGQSHSISTLPVF